MAAGTHAVTGTATVPLALRRPPRNPWAESWRRFRRHRLAVAGLLYLGLLLAAALLAPVLAPHNPVQTDVQRAGIFRQVAWVDDADPRRSGSWDYPLGTDSVGRDVLSRLIYGARVSVAIGLVPTVAILAIGVPIGLIAGYLGGRIDNLLMRLADVVYAFPALLFFLTMQTALRQTRLGTMLSGLTLLFVTLSVVSWTGVARLVRGQTLAIKEREFIEAARVCGATEARIVARHVLPSTLGQIVVAGALTVPFAIVAEIVLSYLGIGIRADARLDAPFPTSWGYMLLEGYQAWQSQPWMLIAPCAAVATLTLACTFVGDGLRDALDPREG
jgi:oligopeptide transport system permease protein